MNPAVLQFRIVAELESALLRQRDQLSPCYIAHPVLGYASKLALSSNAPLHERHCFPRRDGELGPGTNLWLKGLVYTTRTTLLPRQSTKQIYRISVGFKRGFGGAHPFPGFQEVYRRVAAIANWRVSQLTCAETGETPANIILCHGWRGLGDKIVTALITLSLRCSDQAGVALKGESVPTDEALHLPGGATLEELARLAPQHADEIYNELDFTDPSTIQWHVCLSRFRVSLGRALSYHSITIPRLYAPEDTAAQSSTECHHR